MRSSHQSFVGLGQVRQDITRCVITRAKRGAQQQPEEKRVPQGPATVSSGAAQDKDYGADDDALDNDEEEDEEEYEDYSEDEYEIIESVPYDPYEAEEDEEDSEME